MMRKRSAGRGSAWRRGFWFPLRVFFEVPRPLIAILCAPVMQEVRVHQRRILKWSTDLHECLNLCYAQNIKASAVHHRLERRQAQ